MHFDAKDLNIMTKLIYFKICVIVTMMPFRLVLMNLRNSVEREQNPIEKYTSVNPLISLPDYIVIVSDKVFGKGMFFIKRIKVLDFLYYNSFFQKGRIHCHGKIKSKMSGQE